MNNARVDEAATLQRSSVAAFIGENRLSFLWAGSAGQKGRGIASSRASNTFLFFACFAADQFLDLALDNFLVQLYNLLGHGLQSPFRMVCRNFILPEFCKPCLFFPPFNLRNVSDLLTKKKSELKVDAFSSDFQRTRGQKDSPDHPF